MIDFKNGSFFKLSKDKTISNASTIQPIMTEGEEILAEYQTIRDFVIFTNKRILAVNIKGVTGKKKDVSSLPYSKIQAFSMETAGTMDLDAELELYFSGLGKVKFEFGMESDIAEIGKMISDRIL